MLDGSTGYLATSGSMLNTTNSYTVAGWVNLGSSANPATLLSQAGVNGAAFYLQYSHTTGTWAFVVQSTDTANASQVTVRNSSVVAALNTWTYLTGIYDASAKTATLYVNGLQVASASVPATFNAPGPLVIGAVKTTGGATSNLVQGGVSGISAYSSALTAGQVSTLYNGGSLLAPTTVIKSSWTYDQRGVRTSATAPLGNASGATAGSYTAYYTADALGRITITQKPSITTYANGVPSSTPTAVYTRTGYDTFGGKLETEDADGNITATAFNQAGQPTGTTLPNYAQPVSGGSTLIATTHIDYTPTAPATSPTTPTTWTAVSSRPSTRTAAGPGTTTT